MVALASAFIRLRPDPDRAAFTRSGREMGDQAGRAAGDSMTSGMQSRLRDNRGRFVSGGDSIGAATGQGVRNGFSRSLKGFEGGNAFTKVLLLTSARFTLIGAAAGAALPSVLHLTAALAPAAGAVNVLPAALLAGKAAMGTFKIATLGVSDAISSGLTGTAKEAKKALDALPPGARDFTREIIALRPQLEGLRATVAQRFFLPLLNDIKPTAQLYLPMLTREMADLAGPLGGIGEQIARSARSAQVFNAVRSIFQQTGLTVITLRRAIDPLAKAFAALISSTVTALPGLAQGFVNLSTRFAAFISQAAQSGRIRDAFEAAMRTLRDLGGILVNVGSILNSVFRAASVGTGSLLGNLRALTGQAAAFLRSAQGMDALTSVFRTLNTFGAALNRSLGVALPAIAQSLAIVAPALAGLAGPAVDLVRALAPLLPFATGLAAVLIRTLTPAIAALARFLADNQTIMKAALITFTAYKAAVIGLAFAAKVQAAGGLIAFAKATTLVSTVQKIAALTSTALGVAFRFMLGPIGLIITAVGIVIGVLVALYKNNKTFHDFVIRAWAAISGAVRAVATFFVGTVLPMVRAFTAGAMIAFQRFWSFVVAVFNGIRAIVSTQIGAVVAIFAGLRTWVTVTIPTAFRSLQTIVLTILRVWLGGILAIWNSIRTGSFAPLRDYITKTLPDAFRTGVGAIKRAWEAVQAAAKAPVTFVVRSVINPLIRGYNRIAGIFKAPQAAEIGGFASGGRIPGASSASDNRLATVFDGGRAMSNIKVATGEFIVNSRSTAANLPLIQAINQARGRVALGNLDPFMDGASRGGLVKGSGDGIGDFLGKVWSGLKGAASFVANPVEGIKKIAGAALDRIPGGGAIVSVLKGMGSSIISGVGNLLKNFGGAIGGGGIAGGWRGMQAAISRVFPGLNLISGLRPGARTLSDNQSYHALGRAVDYPPNRALAAWIRSTYGAKTKELITPWQDLNLHNGQPHTYTGAVWNQHNFAGGNAHVHWAARHGGLVGPWSGMPPVRLFDRGGYWPSGTLGANMSGHTEYVSPRGAGGGGDVHIHLEGAIIGSQAEFQRMTRAAVLELKRERKLP